MFRNFQFDPLQPIPKEEEEKIKYFAQACKSVYAPDPIHTQIQRISVGDICVDVVENERGVIVIFRGTIPHSYENWKSNFEVDLEQIVIDSNEYGYVHSGFLQSFRKVRNSLFALLSIYKEKPIFVTGHSLGGAMAVLASFYLKKNNFFISDVITYGQPPVGDKEFGERYIEEITTLLCVQNEYDPITIYHHIGCAVMPILKEYHDFGKIRIFAPDIPQRRNQRAGWWQTYLISYYNYHRMEFYGEGKEITVGSSMFRIGLGFSSWWFKG